MSRPVLVIGLMGCSPATDWERLVAGRTIVARSRTIAERCMSAGSTIAHAFDALFDRDQLVGIDDAIARDIVQRAGYTDIAYLTPGPGWAGDATVAALREMTAIEHAAPAPAEPLPAHVQAIDALLLAQAQELAPFDSGSQPLDATVSAAIFNWHGFRVIELATARLKAIYGFTVLPAADATGTIVMPARDPLDSPPSFAALAHITARLRQPNGCPWDREQTHLSMLDDFASEVEEYAEAVRAEEWSHAAEELGDVLLNVLMQAQIGAEAGHFRIEDVLARINAKLVRRHPHVFAGVEASSPADVLAVWNRVKQQEKQGRAV